MKNIILLFAAAAAFCSFCPADGYRVYGTVKGAHDGDTVKMVTYNGFMEKVLAKAVVKNGQYTFTGRQDTATMRYLTCSNGSQSLGFAQFVLENGDTRINLDSASYKYDIQGSKVNNDWCAFYNKEEQLAGESLELYKASKDNKLSKEEANKKLTQMEAKDAELKAFRLKFAKDNINNVAGAYVLAANGRDLDFKETERLVALIPDRVREPEVMELKEYVAAQRRTADNQPFTDFTMKTPEGKDLSISSVASTHKVTLIDFWASWCGPCRAEMPSVKADYAKYHDKGLEIVGVSLDNDGNAWRKAIKDLNLQWPQVSDLKGWNCAAAQIYGVRAIPATVLIKDGKIVARNLRGEELSRKLAELLDSGSQIPQ